MPLLQHKAVCGGGFLDYFYITVIIIRAVLAKGEGTVITDGAFRQSFTEYKGVIRISNFAEMFVLFE